MLNQIRTLILERSYNAKIGHLSSSLSICDLIWALYDDIFDKTDDKFILSKGHASLALYTTLFLKNYITKEEFHSYCKHSGTYLGAHPKHYVAGIPFSTGSLGQGITFATGSALAKKIRNLDGTVYCLISDGEINEGSCWESILFAGHHKLKNLVLLYDNNDWQCFGRTSNVLNNDNINDKMSTFAFDVHEVDGHDINQITKTLQNVRNSSSDKPTFINARTISGKGVSFMENKLEWHYRVMTEEQYQQALKELSL